MPALLVQSTNCTASCIPFTPKARTAAILTATTAARFVASLCMSRKRRRFVVMNQLAFIVIFGADHAALCRDGLRRLVRFEALNQDLLPVRIRLVSKTAITKHGCVMHLHIFWIYIADSLQICEGLCILALQKENPRNLIQHDTVPRILRFHALQRLERDIIVSVRLFD